MTDLLVTLVLFYWMVACMVFLLSGMQRLMTRQVDVWCWQAFCLRFIFSAFWLPAWVAQLMLKETWWE